MTVGDWLSQAVSKLTVAGVESARLDALVLLEHAAGRDRSWLLAHPEYEINSNILKDLGIQLRRRLKREPLAYVLGSKEFYGLGFEVSPAVLIPRPETEAVVATAVKLAPRAARVLEIGTGSGAIAVALAVNRPDLKLTATDISPAALRIAGQNAHQHEVKIKLIKSDLFNGVSGRYDLVLANLPYVPTNTRRQPELAYEPVLALYAGADGLDFYRRFIERLPDYLESSGQAIIEAGPTQRAELKRLAADIGLKLQSISEYVSILK